MRGGYEHYGRPFPIEKELRLEEGFFKEGFEKS